MLRLTALILASILALSSLAATGAGVKKSTSTAAGIKTRSQAKKPPRNETLVTFIELGSVRCIPCKAMQPVMEEIEKDFGSKGVKVVFHDVWTDEGRPFARKYNILAIPTQVFLDKDGREFYRHQGFFPREEIVKVLGMQGIKP